MTSQRAELGAERQRAPVAPTWQSLARPPGWRRARDFEVRWVPPGRPDLLPFAEAAFSVECRQICTKDNLTAEQQRAHYAYSESFTWWVIVIDQRGSLPIVAGSMRICWLSTAMWRRGLRPPCVRDMASEPWFADPEEALGKTTRPNGEPLLGLVTGNGAISLETASVPEEYHRAGVVWIIYAAVCQFTLAVGVSIWFTALDRLEGRAYWVLQRRLMEPFLPYFAGKLARGTLAPGVYFAHVRGDSSKIRVSDAGESLGEVEPPNWTEQRWCDFRSWYDGLSARAALAGRRKDSDAWEDPAARRCAAVFRRLWGDEMKASATFEDLEPLREVSPR